MLQFNFCVRPSKRERERGFLTAHCIRGLKVQHSSSFVSNGFYKSRHDGFEKPLLVFFRHQVNSLSEKRVYSCEVWESKVLIYRFP